MKENNLKRNAVDGDIGTQIHFLGSMSPDLENALTNKAEFCCGIFHSWGSQSLHLAFYVSAL